MYTYIFWLSTRHCATVHWCLHARACASSHIGAKASVVDLSRASITADDINDLENKQTHKMEKMMKKQQKYNNGKDKSAGRHDAGVSDDAFSATVSAAGRSIPIPFSLTSSSSSLPVFTTPSCFSVHLLKIESSKLGSTVIQRKKAIAALTHTLFEILFTLPSGRNRLFLSPAFQTNKKINCTSDSRDKYRIHETTSGVLCHESSNGHQSGGDSVEINDMKEGSKDVKVKQPSNQGVNLFKYTAHLRNKIQHNKPPTTQMEKSSDHRAASTAARHQKDSHQDNINAVHNTRSKQDHGRKIVVGVAVPSSRDFDHHQAWLKELSEIQRQEHIHRRREEETQQRLQELIQVRFNAYGIGYKDNRSFIHDTHAHSYIPTYIHVCVCT